MSRVYEFKFRSCVDRVEHVLRGWGNTRRSAERSARSKLRDLGLDPRDYARVGEGRHVPEAER